jgi:mono/diheme cytochrome c family protein
MRILLPLQCGVTLALCGFWHLAVADDSTGDTMFQQRCAACHTIGDGKRIGPDLSGVAAKRPEEWLLRWIMRPDEILAEKDPIALQLLDEFNHIPMPNLGVTEPQSRALIDYLRRASPAAGHDRGKQGDGVAAVDAPGQVDRQTLAGT